MSFKNRLGYLVKVRGELFTRLRELNIDLVEYFAENYVMMTNELEYEKYLEGWSKLIISNCKSQFIKEVVYELDYSKDELITLFGNFESENELFDKWWTLEYADCMQIPTDWMET